MIGASRRRGKSVVVEVERISGVARRGGPHSTHAKFVFDANSERYGGRGAQPRAALGGRRERNGFISESTPRVESGAGLVDQAGATMQEIEAAIQRVARIVSEIAAASKEQSEGIK
jgi:hypothetical protein